MEEPAGKRTLSIVIIGHIDAGKSTLCGRLLLDYGAVDKRTMGKVEKEANDMGRSTFKLAFLMDLTGAERERGITIATSTNRFETNSTVVTIVDAPGHKDFVKNMITGTCTAEAAVLVIDATPGGFEAGISSGGQTRQHAQLAFASGVTSLIVAVNKMDSIPEADQLERFNVIRNEIGNILKTIGFFKSPNLVPFVPISAFHGRNIGDPTTAYSWHQKWSYKIVKKGEPEILVEGVTLVDAIDSAEKPPSAIGYEVRAALTGYFKHKVGIVASVSLNYGVVNAGDPMWLFPGEKLVYVRTMEIHRTPYSVVYATSVVGMTFKGVLPAGFGRGNVMGPPWCPPMAVLRFTARLIIMFHPTKIKPGYTPVVDTNALHVPCKLDEIFKVKMSKKHEKMVVDPEEVFLTTGDQAEVSLVPKGNFFIEALPDFPRYTRLSVRDSGSVIAIGSCVSRVTQEFDKSHRAILDKAIKARRGKA